MLARNVMVLSVILLVVAAVPVYEYLINPMKPNVEVPQILCLLPGAVLTINYTGSWTFNYYTYSTNVTGRNVRGEGSGQGFNTTTINRPGWAKPFWYISVSAVKQDTFQPYAPLVVSLWSFQGKMISNASTLTVGGSGGSPAYVEASDWYSTTCPT